MSHSLKLCILLVVVFQTTTWLNSQGNTSERVQQGGEPLSISVFAATFDCRSGLLFNWRIKSTSAHDVYIYSAYLKGRSAGHLIYDSRMANVMVPTSMQSEGSAPPYNYPDPEFRRLAPQEQIEGSFFEPLAWDLSCKKVRPRTLTFEIAWVSNPDEILKETAQLKKEGRVHPANAIVHGTKRIKSQPTQITYLHLR